MKKLFKIAGIVLGIIILGIAGLISYVKWGMPNVGKAGQLTIERTPERIERGKYLANHVTVCMDCHSTRDWSLFAGPVKGGWGAGGEHFNHEMGFPGEFQSRNITPYGIGNWTDGEVYRAITSGVSKDGHALFPVMNYPAFGKMDTEDIYSIISYIRTLKPIESHIPERQLDFPVSLLVNTMPAKATPMRRPEEANTPQYGEYLVNAAGCIDCHAKHDKGKLIPGTEFGGGMEFRFPHGVVRSANITPDEQTGIGNWTEDAFVNRFKAYADSSYHPVHINKGDANAVMPWAMYAGMKRSDLAAIYTYLRTVKPIYNHVEHFQKL